MMELKPVITKGSKERTIYFNDEVENASKDYINNGRKDGDTLFVSNYGNKMDKSCVWRTIRTLAKRLFLDDDVIDGFICTYFCERHYGNNQTINKRCSYSSRIYYIRSF